MSARKESETAHHAMAIIGLILMLLLFTAILIGAGQAGLLTPDFDFFTDKIIGGEK